MLTWIKENVALFSIVGSLVICISTAAVTKYQVGGLVAGQAEVHQHMNDSRVHLDPQRDPESARELKARIERLERQVERLERRQAWMINGVRTGTTTSIPVLIDPPN